MTDKVRKIREWVKARLDENASKKSLPQFYGMMEEDARFLDFLDSIQEKPVSEEIWEASKQYALRQVLASTDTEMSEQAYLDLRLFSGFELAVAHKDGANWQKNLNKKDFELLKEWFEDISEKCEHLTSGNVSHNGNTIRGYARNCAEYIKTDLL